MYLDYIKKLTSGKSICIFPMGRAGTGLFDKMTSIGIHVDYFCDNNTSKVGTVYKGCNCISKEELKENNEKTVIIIESLFYQEIKKQLENEGFINIHRIYFEKIAGERFIQSHGDEVIEKAKEVKSILNDEKSNYVYDRIIDSYYKDNLSDDYFRCICDKEQYFDDDIYRLSENECIVDLGAYTGDSAEAFIDKCNGKYKKLHLFELDPAIYRQLMINTQYLYSKTSKGIIQCYPFGASDSNATVSLMVGDSSSKIISASNSDKYCIEGLVRSLDSVLSEDEITLIKSDIEGAEMSALKGAKRIIKEQKPILAFCIYHSLSDTINIPLWIKDIVPEYSIYIRHYTDLMLETVCYAIPKNRLVK